MRKLMFYSIFAAILVSIAPISAEAAPYYGHPHGHIHYVAWHGHRGYWNGPHFVIVEPAPVFVPAYYPQPYPQPVYYAPVPVPGY